MKNTLIHSIMPSSIRQKIKDLINGTERKSAESSRVRSTEEWNIEYPTEYKHIDIAPKAKPMEHTEAVDYCATY